MAKTPATPAVTELPATSFTFRGATIHARYMTIGDENDVEQLLLKLPEETRYVDAYRFGQFVLTAKVEGQPLAFMVKETDSAEAITAAFQRWEQQPGTLWKQFAAALAVAEKEERDEH